MSEQRHDYREVKPDNPNRRYTSTPRGWAIKRSSDLRAQNPGSTITSDELLELWNKCEGRCEWPKCNFTFQLGTGNQYKGPAVDKIIPGLGYHSWNMQILCSKHNTRKSDMTSEEMKRMLEHQLKKEAEVLAYLGKQVVV